MNKEINLRKDQEQGKR
uniref:Uncharacterized protein n=1 Tax=Rhizophora mucronata TaxID=61149 RepID=A0A2P2PB01_RHIMU